MFKNITNLKTEILIIVLSFLLLTIIVVLIEFYSINALNSLQKTTNNIYNHPLKVSNAALNIRLNILKIHRDMKDVVLSNSKDTIVSILKEINLTEQNIYDDFRIIEKDILGNEGYLLYEDAKRYYDDWKPIRDEVIHNMYHKKFEEAIFITKNKGALHVKLLEEKTNRLNQYARKKATSFKNLADETFYKKRDNLYLIIFIVVVFSLYMTYYIGRRFYLYANLIHKNNKKLQKSNLLLSESQKISNMASWENYVKKRKIVWSDDIFNILALDKNNFDTSLINIIRLIHKDDRKRVLDCYRKSLLEKEPYLIEYRIVKANKTVLYVLESATLKYDINNDVDKIVGVLQDITDKKIVEIERNRQLKLNDKLFNNLEISIWNEDLSFVYDKLQDLKAQGIEDLLSYLNQNNDLLVSLANSIKILSVNDVTINMFNAKNEKDFLKNITSTFGQNALDVFKAELLSIWNEDDYFRKEADFYTSDNKEIKGIISFAIPKERNEFKSIPVSILDVTELKEKEKLILLQSRHAAMGEMISMIAHQWRQPITTISMIANNQLLDLELGDFNNDILKNYSKDIIDQTQHLSKTIDDFRNFFKVSSSKDRVSLDELLKEIFSLIKTSFDNNAIKLSYSLDQDVVMEVKKRELEQVLINILNNAKDALVINKITNPEVEISCQVNSDFVQIIISDNATGIKEENLSKIFDPYFTTKNSHNGTGLGLYMSKIIIEEHLSGEIKAKNNDDVGASFIIRLNLNKNS